MDFLYPELSGLGCAEVVTVTTVWIRENPLDNDSDFIVIVLVRRSIKFKTFFESFRIINRRAIASRVESLKHSSETVGSRTYLSRCNNYVLLILLFLATSYYIISFQLVQVKRGPEVFYGFKDTGSKFLHVRS